MLDISKEAKAAEPDVSKIAAAISEDVSISAAVLQVVNSAAFRRSSEVKSIQQAVMTLGLQRLFPLVKAVALKSTMSVGKSLDSFWKKCSLIAHCCPFVAQKMNKPELADHAYMLGLFHTAGIPLMLQTFDDYLDFMKQAESEGWSEVIDLEREKYATTHATLGALLGQQWKLPKVMIETIYYQHDVDGIYTSGELNDLGLDLLSILKVSRNIAEYKDKGELETPEWVKVEEQFLSYYELEQEEVDEMREEIVDELEADGEI